MPSRCVTFMSFAYASAEDLAYRASRLAVKRDGTRSVARSQMLEKLRRAYMAMSLSKMHARYDSPHVDALMKAAAEHYRQAQVICGTVEDWLE